MTVRWLTAASAMPAGVIAGTTLRTGGRSAGSFGSLNLGAHVGDDPRAVEQNRQAFVEACGLPAAPLWLRQVHGTTVIDAAAADREPRADAAVTDQRGVVCAVLTADCLPVVFAACDGSEVAVAHAGWRGLCAGILEQTVSTMRSPAPGLLAWLGPAISQPAFEVGDEVRQAFVRQDAGAADSFLRNGRERWQADLFALARRRLERCGITRVSGGDRCTFGEPEAFFSFRRDGDCGRMATFAFLDGGSA